MNMKLCRVLETSFNVLEMLKVVYIGIQKMYLVTIVTPQKRGVLTGKSLDISRKYQYSICYQIHNLKDSYKTCLANNSLVIAHFKNIIFVWVGKPDFREG